MLRSRIGGATDTRRAAAALSHPGIDPRVWVSQAVVTAVHFDPEHGHFVDVMLLPSKLPETARVAPIYSGAGFGLYLPLEVDDEVIVAVPHGNPDAGLVAFARPWDAGTPPPSEIANRTQDLLLLAKPGATVRIATQGSGNVVLDARGTGEVQLGGESGLSPCARQGDSIQVDISSLTSALDSRYMTNPGPPPISHAPTGSITSGSGKVKVK